MSTSENGRLAKESFLVGVVREEIRQALDIHRLIRGSVFQPA
jgi:hypothetical protein